MFLSNLIGKHFFKSLHKNFGVVVFKVWNLDTTNKWQKFKQKYYFRKYSLCCRSSSGDLMVKSCFTIEDGMNTKRDSEIFQRNSELVIPFVYYIQMKYRHVVACSTLSFWITIFHKFLFPKA